MMMTMIAVDANVTAWCVGQGMEVGKARGVCESCSADGPAILEPKEDQTIYFLLDVVDSDSDSDFDFDFEGTGKTGEHMQVLWTGQPEERRPAGKSAIAVNMAVLRVVMTGAGESGMVLVVIPVVLVMDCLSAIATERIPAASMLISLEQGAVTRCPSEIPILSRRRRLQAIGETHWASRVAYRYMALILVKMRTVATAGTEMNNRESRDSAIESWYRVQV